MFTNIERAADISRTGTYGKVNELADDVLRRLSGSKGNPQEIADVVLKTIETPMGQRKLRQRE